MKIKKILAITTLFATLTTTSFGEIIKINNKDVEISTKIINNRKLVPLRELGNALGLSIKWDNNTNNFIISNGTKNIIMNTNKDTANINGNNIKLETKPTILDSKVYLPLRFIVENTGNKLKLNGDILEVSKIDNYNETLKETKNIQNNTGNVNIIQQDYEKLKDNISLIDEYVCNKTKEDFIKNKDIVFDKYVHLNWEDLSPNEGKKLSTILNFFGEFSRYYDSFVRLKRDTSEAFEKFDKYMNDYILLKTEFLKLVK